MSDGLFVVGVELRGREFTFRRRIHLIRYGSKDALNDASCRRISLVRNAATDVFAETRMASGSIERLVLSLRIRRIGGDIRERARNYDRFAGCQLGV